MALLSISHLTNLFNHLALIVKILSIDINIPTSLVNNALTRLREFCITMTVQEKKAKFRFFFSNKTPFAYARAKKSPEKEISFLLLLFTQSFYPTSTVILSHVFDWKYFVNKENSIFVLVFSFPFSLTYAFWNYYRKWYESIFLPFFLSSSLIPVSVWSGDEDLRLKICRYFSLEREEFIVKIVFAFLHLDFDMMRATL